MFNFWTVMYLLFVGVVAGFVARLLVPGRDARAGRESLRLACVTAAPPRA